MLNEAWATEADVGEECKAIAGEHLDNALWVASSILYNLTRRRWPGVVTQTIRPCGCRGEVCGRCLPQITLPGRPVVAVEEVMVDGMILDPLAYRVDNAAWLVRVDDEGWPCCQNMRLPTSEPGTMQVTYSWGSTPGVEGIAPTVALACELAKLWSPTHCDKCRLPTGTRTVTRQGLTIEIEAPGYMDGQTGLPEVDMWVASVLLGDARRPGTVMVPGKGSRTPRRTTIP